MGCGNGTASDLDLLGSERGQRNGRAVRSARRNHLERTTSLRERGKIRLVNELIVQNERFAGDDWIFSHRLVAAAVGREHGEPAALRLRMQLERAGAVLEDSQIVG